MKRIERVDYFLSMAQIVAKRSTCLRRQVGCVLTNRLGHVLATGYNGVARGFPHCNREDKFWETGYPNACAGAFAPSGEKLDLCEAIHAEQNALLQCGDVESIEACYVTVSPCIHCMKLLLNTSCRVIYTLESYSHSADLWKRGGRELIVYTPEFSVQLVSKHFLQTETRKQ